MRSRRLLQHEFVEWDQGDTGMVSKRAVAKRLVPESGEHVHDDLCIPKNPSEGFFTTAQWQRIAEALDLSDRELRVAILLFEGQKREAIACHLCKADGSHLSPETVRVYIDRLFKKARVSDRVGFVLRIVRVHHKLSEHG